MWPMSKDQPFFRKGAGGTVQIADSRNFLANTYVASSLDDGKASEFNTLLVTDFVAHTPPDILAQNFRVPAEAFSKIPLHVPLGGKNCESQLIEGDDKFAAIRTDVLQRMRIAVRENPQLALISADVEPGRAEPRPPGSDDRLC